MFYLIYFSGVFLSLAMIYFHNKYAGEYYQTLNPFFAVFSWFAAAFIIPVVVIMYYNDLYTFQNKNKEKCIKKIIRKTYKFFNYTPSNTPPAAPFGPK